ncbi:MAG: hypothetical protein LBC28_06350, partial [Oscillospiraceae bacterium]|nr:hypothetical protein [Oscillospiraceae bacterium]
MGVLFFLALLFIASPILAVVFGVLYSRKSSALTRLADLLYAAGRITRAEYISAVGRPPRERASADAGSAAPETPAENGAAPSAAPVQPPASVTTPISVSVVAPRSFNTAPLILALGVVLICASGLIFVTSNWNTLSDAVKIGVILLGAAVFFAAFALARFKLSLDNTGRAFYILGCAAAACAALAAILLGAPPYGRSLGALASPPFALMTLGAVGGYFLYRDRLFLALKWIFAYVSVNFFSLWFFADALGSAELFSVVPVCVCALGMLFVFVFSAERFPESFYRILALASFALSAAITIALSAVYRQSVLPDRATLALSLAVITITLSVAAKKSGLKFLFPLQSAAAMWTAHALSGVVLFGNDWRAALDIALMFSAFLWSRYNINRGDGLSFAAYNLLFPVSAMLTILSSDLDFINLSPQLAATLSLPALVYIALTITEREQRVQKIFAATAVAFGAFALASVGINDVYKGYAFYTTAAVICAATAFTRVPRFEQSAPIQRILGFALCLFAQWTTGEEALLTRALFIALAAVIALTDALASREKYRRGIGGIIVYGFSLWLIADLMLWRGFSSYNVAFDLRRSWSSGPWFDMIPTVLYAVTTLVLVAESVLFHKRGTWKRASFVVAAIANNIFAAVQSSALLALSGGGTGRELQIIYASASIVFGAAGCYVMYRREGSYADIFPALALFLGAVNILSVSDIREIQSLTVILLGGAVCAFYGLFLGRKRRGYSNLRAVWVISCAGLILHNYTHSFDPHSLIRLAGAFLLSLNLLQYLRTRATDVPDRALITASSAVFCLASAIWLAARSEFDAEFFRILRPELVAAILVGGAFAVARVLWRFNDASHWAAFGVCVYCAAFIYFGAEAPRLFHIAAVTAAALSALGLSLRFKRGRWFMFGMAAVCVIFFRETAEFWLNLKWWVYLLTVGLILIAIAAVNEAGRRRGAGLMEKLKR